VDSDPKQIDLVDFIVSHIRHPCNSHTPPCISVTPPKPQLEELSREKKTHDDETRH